MTKLNDLLHEIRKGSNVYISLLSDDTSPCVVAEWISTGCMVLDAITGGGFPVGRVTEIYGDTSTGKSLLAAQAIAQAQADGHICLLIDTETTASLPIMDAVGVDVDNLIYSAPDTIEEVFELIYSTIDARAKTDPDKLLLIVWDSIAATSARMEMDADVGKATMGRHAVLISQAMRKMTRVISKNRICCVFLNQTRANIGVVFGDSETTFGGKAVPFHSSVRIRLKLGPKIKSGTNIVGIQTVATVVKNKIAVPFLKAQLPIYFGFGVDDAEAALLYLKDAGVVKSSGGWQQVEIGGEQMKFQSAGWDDIFEKYYDAIHDMIMEIR